MTSAWIVGGALRDKLLGRRVTDVDVAVRGDPQPVARALAGEVRGPVFRLSEAFGAWRVIDRRLRRVYDVATLQGQTIEEDLAKRDFTVNAMATPLAEVSAAALAEPTARPLVDPLGGRADLEARTLRVIGARAYDCDPLRALRLARFAAELGFEPDAETERLTRIAAPKVAEAAGERVFAELRRLVLAPGVIGGLDVADRLGVLRAVLPELTALHDVEQSHYHHLDVYGHTIEVLERLIELEPQATGRLRAVLDEPLADELTRGQALRFGALLHDIGKPATHAVREEGRVTFMGHDRLGEEMVRDVCRRLRTSERFSRFVEALTRHHLVLGFLVPERPLDRRAVYRYLRRTEPVEVEVTWLSCADRLATRGRRADEAIAAHMELARELIEAALEWRERGPPPPLIRGDELARELGIDRGPELGRLLACLEEATYAGEVATREDALSFARRLRENPTR
ncbi:MAG TPA: HD domain-containing protein [Thermoleophilaceae bacterium]|nr:HD domain-containing protein [Thermoleophilaceae bacterium]